MHALVLFGLSIVAMAQVETAQAQSWRHPLPAPTPSSSSAQSSVSSVSVSSAASAHSIATVKRVAPSPQIQTRLRNLGTVQITRSEFVGMLIDELYTQQQMDNCYSDIASTRPPRFTKLFADVRTTDRNAKQICLAMRDGILRGYSDGTYRPSNPVTFAEASKLIARAYVLAPYGETRTAVGPWYGAYVDALGVHKAIPLTITNLNQRMTAADTAEILHRLNEGILSRPSRTYGELDNLTFPPAYRPVYTGTSRTIQIIKPATGSSSSVKSMSMSVSSVQVSSKKSVVSSAGASGKMSAAAASSMSVMQQASSEADSKWLKWY